MRFLVAGVLIPAESVKFYEAAALLGAALLACIVQIAELQECKNSDKQTMQDANLQQKDDNLSRRNLKRIVITRTSGRDYWGPLKVTQKLASSSNQFLPYMCCTLICVFVFCVKKVKSKVRPEKVGEMTLFPDKRRNPCQSIWVANFFIEMVSR